MSDFDLLLRYCQGSQHSFAELVRRHWGWVYAAALRRTRDAHVAEDVAQATFLVLARRAQRLPADIKLGPWLFRVMNYSAACAMRALARRRKHERFAAAQRAHATSPSGWETISGELDELLMGLKTSDREAIVLRFYQGESYAQLAADLGIGEDAARKRVDRALERLRQRFAGRGVTLTTAALASTLATNLEPAEAAAVNAPTAAAAALADQLSGVLVATTLKIAAACCILLLSAAALPLVVQWFAARPQAPRVQAHAVMPVTTAASRAPSRSAGWSASGRRMSILTGNPAASTR
jgi:RNA polymerase sigma factor (sigma-70 family)